MGHVLSDHFGKQRSSLSSSAPFIATNLSCRFSPLSLTSSTRSARIGIMTSALGHLAVSRTKIESLSLTVSSLR